MEYVKGEPYFCKAKNKIKNFPYLNKDIKCEILIIGGGINGIILNNYLSENHDVVLVDKSRLGYNCTSSATALLEYQLDDFAEDLSNELTNEEIIKIYKMGLKSIKEICEFIKKNGNFCEFSLKSTLVFTDQILKVKKFKNEYKFREENGFEVKFIDEENNPFPFKIKAGIFCKNGGAEFNPYLFCKQMIETSYNQSKIFENTEIDSIYKEDDKIIAKTNFGNKITCKKIIISTGFNETLTPQKNLSEKFISYSIVTNPIDNFDWYDKCLIQDFKDPYHYLRLLPDNRIIFGGEDTKYNIKKPINEKLALKKYKALENQLKKMFPFLKDKIQIDYKFCGLFASTTNNLGVIGKSNEDPNILYFLSCGANGIINAIFGRHLIEDILNELPNDFEYIFSAKRLL